GVAPEVVHKLHGATAGNPLALLELASESQEVALAPEGAPLLISARIARAFLRRVQTLDEPVRRALVLAATSDSGDLPVLARAGRRTEPRSQRVRHRRRSVRAGRALVGRERPPRAAAAPGGGCSLARRPRRPRDGVARGGPRLDSRRRKARRDRSARRAHRD